MAMMQIGLVQFKPRGPSYENLKNAAKFMWPSQGRFGRRDALQFTGEGEETVEVTGTIYTDYFDGFGAIKKFKRMARVPQMVVSGAGDVFGLWSIVDVSNVQTFADKAGKPAKVEFTLTLMRYGEDGAGLSGRLF